MDLSPDLSAWVVLSPCLLGLSPSTLFPALSSTVLPDLSTFVVFSIHQHCTMIGLPVSYPWFLFSDWSTCDEPSSSPAPLVHLCSIPQYCTLICLPVSYPWDLFSDWSTCDEPSISPASLVYLCSIPQYCTLICLPVSYPWDLFSDWSTCDEPSSSLDPLRPTGRVPPSGRTWSWPAQYGDTPDLMQQ